MTSMKKRFNKKINHIKLPYASIKVLKRKKIKLNKNGCLLIHKTDREMAKQYVSNTSGIQMV